MRAAAIELGALLLPLTAAYAQAEGVPKAAFQAGGRTRLMQADSDGDGRISAAEWAAMIQARGGRRDPARSFARLDRNRDGSLDAAEVDAFTAHRFDRLDANRDGKVSADERAAVRGGPGV